MAWHTQKHVTGGRPLSSPEAHSIKLPTPGLLHQLWKAGPAPALTSLHAQPHPRGQASHAPAASSSNSSLEEPLPGQLDAMLLYSRTPPEATHPCHQWALTQDARHACCSHLVSPILGGGPSPPLLWPLPRPWPLPPSPPGPPMLPQTPRAPPTPSTQEDRRQCKTLFSNLCPIVRWARASHTPRKSLMPVAMSCKGQGHAV